MNTNETLGIEEAAALLRAETETVMHYARRGALPGTRIGRTWVFMREDVLSFLRAQIEKDTEQRRQKNNDDIARAALIPTARSKRRARLPDLSGYTTK